MQPIEFDGRPIVPVRMIPYVTGGHFSADTVALILAEQDDIHRVTLRAHYLSSTGDSAPLSAKEWDRYVTVLDELQAQGLDYDAWTKASITALPAAVFVFYADLESAYTEAYSPDRMHLVDGRPEDRQLLPNPYLPPRMVDSLLEGFEPLLQHDAEDQPANPQESEPSDECVFRRERTGTWRVRFMGQEQYFTDRKGLRYIQLLLQRPGVELGVDQLSAIVNSEGALDAVDEGSLLQAGLSIGSLGSAGERLPILTLKEYRKVLESLNGQLEEAKETCDVERSEGLQEQISKIERMVKQGTDLYGRPLLDSDAFERARQAVSKATRNSIRYIEKNFPALGDHLKESISTGNALIYKPKESFSWAF